MASATRVEPLARRVGTSNLNIIQRTQIRKLVKRGTGLKIRCPQGRAGSTPALGTKLFSTLMPGIAGAHVHPLSVSIKTCSLFSGHAGLKQLVRRNWQVPDATAGGMEDCVGDAGGDPYHSEFAHAFHAKRVDHFVVLFNKHRLDFKDVGIY